jgi:uncharacterized membrane protein
VNRWLRAASWVLFAGVMYLILTGALRPWIQLPGLGDVGFTVVFVLFAVVHCAVMEGARRTLGFFATSAVVSYLMEEIGVRTGFIFGAYHYSDQLGPKIGHVPLLIPLAWFMMIYPAWVVAEALVSGVDTRSVRGLAAQSTVAALVMTAWDVAMDPGMSAAGNWIWDNGGAYFGVPRHNYVGWLITTFLVYLIAGLLLRGLIHRASETRVFASLPLFVYGLFAVRYMTSNTVPALQLIALFSMGTPALLALIRTFGIQSTDRSFQATSTLPDPFQERNSPNT